MPIKVQSGYTHRMITTLLQGDKPKALPAGYGRRVADRFRNAKSQPKPAPSVPISSFMKSSFLKLELLPDPAKRNQFIDDHKPLFFFRFDIPDIHLPPPASEPPLLSHLKLFEADSLHVTLQAALERLKQDAEQHPEK